MFIFWIIVIFTSCHASSPPNILLIVADDLGYNDISWHNPDIISPNLEKLAKNGVILESHYVQSICTPSRSALMTGMYPIHTGRQHSYLRSQEPKGLFTNFTLMPQYFKAIGYKTHAVGKWHLGFCNKEYLPTRRGFDTFYGFYSGSEDYYHHSRHDEDDNLGYDFRDQEMVDYSANGTYSSILFAKRAIGIINDHANNHSGNPFFLYLPFQNVHWPYQVPDKYKNLYPNIKNHYRKIFSGMVTAMDDAVGEVVETLKRNNLFDNTIIVFTSDNGGETIDAGNNYPLRGNKKTLWEGGTRASSFVYSSLLKKHGLINNELIHVVDWVPTLLSAVKDTLAQDNKELVNKFLAKHRDGIDQWEVIKNHSPSKRTEFLYNIDPLYTERGYPMGNAGIRIGELKLLVGNPGKIDGHIPPDKVPGIHPGTYDSICEATTDEERSKHCNKYEIDGIEIHLFNITDDPYEYDNIAKQNPNLVKKMMKRLEEYRTSMIPPDVAPDSEKGNPKHFNGTFSPGWCRSEPSLIDIGTDAALNILLEILP